jgi:glycosyltransferase involved in cell wall biosynthesis
MVQKHAIIAVVVAYNEVDNIERTLKSVHGLCPIVVVDSGSTDGTLEICSRYADVVLCHPYDNHASQWQWAIDNLPFDATWILALDADFEVMPELREKIRTELTSVPDDVSGIYVVQRYVFIGNEIRHGGGKRYWLPLVRRGFAAPDHSDMVDFRFVVKGKTIKWNAFFRHYNKSDEDASFWIRKQDKFSLRLAVEEESRRAKALDWETPPKFFGNPDERVMWLRDRWLHMPLFIRPCIYFFYRYFIRLGFLDGRGGFLYHAQQGFWMRLVVDWKVWQLRKYGISGELLTEFKNAMLKTSNGSVRDIWNVVKHASDSRASTLEK